MCLIMNAYVILHNMTVEDERDSYGLTFDYKQVQGTTLEPHVQRNVHPCHTAYLRRKYKFETLNHICVYRQTWLKKYGTDIDIGHT